MNSGMSASNRYSTIALLDVPSLYAQHRSAYSKLMEAGLSFPLVETFFLKHSLNGCTNQLAVVAAYRECRGNPIPPSDIAENNISTAGYLLLDALYQRFLDHWQVEFLQHPHRSILEVVREGYHADTLAIKVTYHRSSCIPHPNSVNHGYIAPQYHPNFG